MWGAPLLVYTHLDSRGKASLLCSRVIVLCVRCIVCVYPHVAAGGQCLLHSWPCFIPLTEPLHANT